MEGREHVLTSVRTLVSSRSPIGDVANGDVMERIVGGNKNSPNIGMTTDDAEKTTIDRYNVVWRQLLQFCLIVGDYVSAAIFDPSTESYDGMCPKSPTAASIKTCILFLKFQSEERDTI